MTEGGGLPLAHAAGVSVVAQPLKTHAAQRRPRRARRAHGARSRGYEMPVQYRDGMLKEHLWTRAHAGAFDVSHMGPAFLTLNEKSGDGEADHRGHRRADRAPGQRRHRRAEARPDPLHAAAQRGRRDRRRPDDRPAGPAGAARACSTSSSTPARRRGTSRSSSARPAAAPRSTRADDRALIAVQGPEAAAVVAALFPGAADLAFMTYRRIEYRRRAAASSPAPATPARTGSRSWSAAPARVELWDRLLADERVRPIGLGARDSPAARGRPAAVRPRPRRDRLADRGRPRLRRRQAPAEGRRSARRGAHRARAGRRPEPDARRPARARGRSGARRRRDRRCRRRGRRPRHQRRLLAVAQRAHRHGLRPARRSPRRERRLNVIVRGKPQAAEVAALPFVPHRYVRSRLRRTAHALHQGS